MIPRNVEIRPGDLLQCIDASPYRGGTSQLAEGRVYEVASVWGYLPHEGDETATWWDCAVDLVGVPPPSPDIAWGLYRFRPFSSASSALLN